MRAQKNSVSSLAYVSFTPSARASGTICCISWHSAFASALSEASRRGIRGQALTPFVLS
jgi:hypothetical protein